MVGYVVKLGCSTSPPLGGEKVPGEIGGDSPWLTTVLHLGKVVHLVDRDAPSPVPSDIVIRVHYAWYASEISC